MLNIILYTQVIQTVFSMLQRIHNDAKLEAKATLYPPSYTLYLQMIVQSEAISELISNCVKHIPHHCFPDRVPLSCALRQS